MIFFFWLSQNKAVDFEICDAKKQEQNDKDKTMWEYAEKGKAGNIDKGCNEGGHTLNNKQRKTFKNTYLEE